MTRAAHAAFSPSAVTRRLRAQARTTQLVLFAVGVVLFIACMLLLGWWFRDSQGGLSERARLFHADGANASAPENLDERISTARAQAQSREVRVYFTTDGISLQPQTGTLPDDLADAEKLRFVLAELVRGPVSGFYSRTLPEGAQLLSVYMMDDHTAIVDLGGGICDKPLGGVSAELLAVYSLVNTVIENVPSVQQVRLLIDGRSMPALWGGVDISEPLNANLALVQNR